MMLEWSRWYVFFASWRSSSLIAFLWCTQLATKKVKPEEEDEYLSTAQVKEANGVDMVEV